MKLESEGGAFVASWRPGFPFPPARWRLVRRVIHVEICMSTMSVHARTVVVASVVGWLAPVPAARGQGAAQPSAAVWDSVGKILGAAPSPAAGYTRFNFPRRDITLRVGDVTVAPALALGSWVGFAGPLAGSTMMGDLVLLPSELVAVQRRLADRGIAVTAVHNHLAGEFPEVVYLHFHATGAATELARRLDTVLGATA